MSALGDLRDSLKRVADMMPLSSGEKEIAIEVYRVGGVDADEIVSDPDFWGEDVVELIRFLFPGEVP